MKIPAWVNFLLAFASGVGGAILYVEAIKTDTALVEQKLELHIKDFVAFRAESKERSDKTSDQNLDIIKGMTRIETLLEGD